MKAPPFHYVRAQSRTHALELLAQHQGDARVLAGGQSLMPVLNMRLAAPALLLDINGVAELAGITVQGSTVRIGAMTRHCDVAASPIVRQHLPLIAEAMQHVAHPAIRNRGTFGGSIAAADPSAEMPACCVALQAHMLVESTRGTRTIEASEFFRGIFETALAPDELLVAIEILIPDASWAYCFSEFARRHGDYAIVGLAAMAQLSVPHFADIRLVLFGVADRAVRAKAAERALVDSPSPAEAIAHAQAAIDGRLSSMSDSHASAEMRLHLARVLVGRTIHRLQHRSLNT